VFKKSDVKNVDTVQEQYSELFSGLGKTNWEYTIKLKPGYVPFALSTPRRVPLPLMEKVKKEFQRMENMGVISRVDKPPFREQEHHPCDIRLLLFLQGSRTYVSGRTRARRKSRTADAETERDWHNIKCREM
jgi:hypothetical protein